MDPDGKWTSTRATLLAATGKNCWPPAGSYMAATGQDLMARRHMTFSIASALFRHRMRSSSTALVIPEG